MIEELYRRLTNIETKSPVLLLGDAAKFFKQNYSGNIIKPTNINELINYNNTVIKLTIFDFSSFSSNISSLNTFISNFNKPLIVLTDDINIDAKLLSSFKTIIKFSEKSKSNLSGATKALEDWSIEEDKSNFTRFLAKESPELYYYKNKFNMNKYIDLFSSE